MKKKINPKKLFTHLNSSFWKSLYYLSLKLQGLKVGASYDERIVVIYY